MSGRADPKPARGSKRRKPLDPKGRERASKWRHRFQTACLRGCAVASEGCEGSIEAHHVTPKAAIKRYAATHGLTQLETAQLVWDPRNALGVCERHHARHTKALERLPQVVIPVAAWGFADELGLTYLLERTYARGV